MNISKLLSNRVRNIETNPFSVDLITQSEFLNLKINNKKILIIGGAYLIQILGFINSPNVQISFERVEASFDDVFNNSKSEKLDIIKVINKYVSDFMHIETCKHLDQKM